MKKERSAGFITYKEYNNERVYLLLKHKKSHWDFAKGHIEQGEEEIDAAIREIREETGITDLDIIDGFKEEINYTFTKNDQMINKSVTLFLTRVETDEIKISDEHTAYTWATYQKAYKLLTYAESRGVLEHAENFLNVRKRGYSPSLQESKDK
ncbi:MAG: NUDIX domain-containing protein [Candidatus Methanoliparum thermophilum]|uniref:Bis(5'-nucleosyl)-tetraphosphatase [asymmetrical] n=1 Tax=Methanoliparum thermophilum TaxID=2491083 RepID=A0A520KS57_METT2|nr:bis(5'-nucleosyl)-tetraphosphatase [Candidatus Methanoliparum sp. LAM-1]RZN64052.1 MAG: NUDIX domain-containing protein [Candidatus Methanoliparum thermophilum]BDC35693.1 diadenosine 5'5'''-P1,P4-tetraphosphate pyrophosphohydrolase [Candidatus Methanoliparum sp. LAM-1]